MDGVNPTRRKKNFVTVLLLEDLSTDVGGLGQKASPRSFQEMKSPLCGDADAAIIYSRSLYRALIRTFRAERLYQIWCH